MESLLLWQVDNAGPSAPLGPPSEASLLHPPTLTSGVFDTMSRPMVATAIAFLQAHPTYQRYLLDSPAAVYLQWLAQWEIPPDFIIPPLDTF